MKKLFPGLLGLLIFVSFTFAQNLSLSNGPSRRQQLSAYMQYGDQDQAQDTVAYSFAKSPALAFMMSAAVPGVGQFYTEKKWWAAGFLGAEILGWGFWYNRKTVGEDLEDEYKSWADGQNGDKWDFYQWVDNYNSEHGFSHNMEAYLTDSEGNMIEGTTFELFQEINGQTKLIFDDMFDEEGDDIVKVDDQELLNILEENNISVDEIQVVPVRSRDYYENIGKYDQFTAGWIDFDSDTLYKEGIRMDYMNKRDESNQALKLATKSLTVVMFNHLFSALHAQFAAKHYSDDADKPEQMGWNLSLTPSMRKGQLISSINLSFAL